MTTDARKEYHHARYLGRREEIAGAYDREREARVAYARERRKSLAETSPLTPGAWFDNLPDPRTPIERARADAMECVRLRLLWAAAEGGDGGTCARCAVRVIRFAEADGRAWSDRGLRGLHRRLCLAAGMSYYAFRIARAELAKSLFIPF